MLWFEKCLLIYVFWGVHWFLSLFLLRGVQRRWEKLFFWIFLIKAFHSVTVRTKWGLSGPFLLLYSRKHRALTLQHSVVCWPTLSFLASRNPRKRERSPDKDTGVDFFHVPLHRSTSTRHSPPLTSTGQSHFPDGVLLMHFWVFMRTGV